MRTANWIEERNSHGINPSVIVDRGHNLLEVHRTFYGVCAQAVDQADRLARLYAERAVSYVERILLKSEQSVKPRQRLPQATRFVIERSCHLARHGAIL